MRCPILLTGLGRVLSVASGPFPAHLDSCADDANSPPATAGVAATTGSHPKTADDLREAEERKPPYIGMTKAQALARYGDPKQHTVTDEGEQWTYLLNYGELIGKAFIPFNFKPTLARTGTLTFGPDGMVKEFRWDAETNG